MPNSLSLFTLFSRVSAEEMVDVNHTKTVSALFKQIHTRIAVVFKTKTEKMLHTFVFYMNHVMIYCS